MKNRDAELVEKIMTLKKKGMLSSLPITINWVRSRT
jgi:hypothetical protein